MIEGNNDGNEEGDGVEEGNGQGSNLAGKLPHMYPVLIPSEQTTDRPNLMFLLALTLDQ